MILEYIRYTIPQPTSEAFEAAYEQAFASLRESSHCLGYDLARCTEEPTQYILRIKWDSAEGHLHGFRKSPEFQQFFVHVRPFFDAIEEMRHYEPLASS